MGRIGGRRLGGVGGVRAALLFEVVDAALQGGETLFVGVHQDQERRLSGGRDLVPEFARNRRRRRHTAEVEIQVFSGNVRP